MKSFFFVLLLSIEEELFKTIGILNTSKRIDEKSELVGKSPDWLFKWSNFTNIFKPCWMWKQWRNQIWPFGARPIFYFIFEIMEIQIFNWPCSSQFTFTNIWSYISYDLYHCSEPNRFDRQDCAIELKLSTWRIIKRHKPITGHI